MARIAAAAPALWIGADEGIHALDDIARHHERKAARGASLKAIKLGGLRALFDAGGLCARLGMRINISCKTGESSVASAAAAHIAAVVPELAWGLTVTSPGLAEDVVTVPVARRAWSCRGAGRARARHRSRRAPGAALPAGIQARRVDRDPAMGRLSEDHVRRNDPADPGSRENLKTLWRHRHRRRHRSRAWRGRGARHSRTERRRQDDIVRHHQRHGARRIPAVCSMPAPTLRKCRPSGAARSASAQAKVRRGQAR